MTDWAFASALDLAQEVRSRNISPVEVVVLYLDRIARINPELAAYVTVAADQALEVARAQEAAISEGRSVGPFAGVPLPIKDLNPVAGIRTTFSHKAFVDYVPDADPALMRRLRAAGFVFIGKTNAPEFGTIGATESDLNGVCKNPWRPELSAGGSSGGAAAAVAAGLAPAAHGSDGGGSIRIPAAFCGVFGMKPSRGRISRGPAVGDVLHGLATDGPLTRTVADAAAMLDVMAGYETGDPYWAPPPSRSFLEVMPEDPGSLRVGVCLTSAWDVTVADDCLVALAEACDALTVLGHLVTDTDPPWRNPRLQQDLRTLFSSVMAYARPTTRDLMEPHNQALDELGSRISAQDYVRTLVRVQAYARTLVALWDDFDVLLTPTTPFLAPRHGFLLEDGDPWEEGSRQFDLIAFTVLANITGQPAVSIPIHWTTAGLPVGVQVIGRPADEATLLQLSAQLERVRPWADRRPPISG